MKQITAQEVYLDAKRLRSEVLHLQITPKGGLPAAARTVIREGLHVASEALKEVQGELWWFLFEEGREEKKQKLKEAKQ